MKSVPESSGNKVRFFNCHDIVLIESTLLILHVFQNSLSPTIIITTTKVLRAGMHKYQYYLARLKSSSPCASLLQIVIFVENICQIATVMIKINTTIVVTFIIMVMMMMQAGEKVTLGISILLSLVVFLLLVSKILVIIMIRMMMVMMMMGMVIIMMVMLIMMLAASHLPRAASDSQVSTLHLHHEHSQV